MRDFIRIILEWRYLILVFFYCRSDSKQAIGQDIARWNEELKCSRRSTIGKLLFFLRNYKYFRNLFYYRVKVPRLIRFFFPPDQQLTITTYCKIDGGLFFWHPFGTIILARKIGRNCTIRQLTTIGNLGKSHDVLDAPELGDNVNIGANVTIIGPVHIGDNAIIGAGSVVVKDVPANATVAGNPAKILHSRN